MRFGTRELIFLLLLLGIPVASYYFVFQRWNVQVAEARKEIQQKEAKLDQLKQATANMEDLDGEIKKIKKTVAVFEKRLPARREAQVVLKQVTQLGQAHHLSIKSWSSDTIVKAANYTKLPIKMKIVGDFDSFYSFLLDMEKLPRITRMPEMTMKKLRDNKDGQMEADIVLNIFCEDTRENDV